MKWGKNYEIVFTTLMSANSVSRRYWSEILDLEFYLFSSWRRKVNWIYWSDIGWPNHTHFRSTIQWNIICIVHPSPKTKSLSTPISSPLLTSTYAQPHSPTGCHIFMCFCVMYIWFLVSPLAHFHPVPQTYPFWQLSVWLHGGKFNMTAKSEILDKLNKYIVYF